MLSRVNIALLVLVLTGSAAVAADDARQEACKAAMNARIQACTDDCTKAALAAASNYVDTNNNVKFGCLKGCAIRQVMQMQSCSSSKDAGQSVETNR